MGDVYVFPIVQTEHVPAYSDPKWQRSATTPVRTQDDRNVSLAKTRLRRWKDGAWDVFELDFETQTLAFRPLSEGTSDPLRSPNTERVRAIRCAPSLDDRKHSGKVEHACEADPDPLRSDLARSGHRSIAISPATSWTQTEPIRLILVKLGMIVRDDQGDHRACVARSCRGILVFWGAKTFLPAILQITKRCQKLTKLTSLVPRRAFLKSVEGVFWFHNTFCFMPL